MKCLIPTDFFKNYQAIQTNRAAWRQTIFASLGIESNRPKVSISKGF